MISKDRPLSNTKKTRTACIDLGSSYFRLLVAETAPGTGRIAVLEDRRAYIGWGRYLAIGGGIPREAVSDAAAGLEDLLGLAARHEPGRTVIVGTNTLREAPGRAGLVSALERRSGHSLRVLTQEEEAELTFLAATSRAEAGDAGGSPASLDVVIDTGGTSSEIAWGRYGRMEGYAGLNAGAHTVLGAAIRRDGGRTAAVPARMLMRASRRIVVEGQMEGGIGPDLLSLLPERAENLRIHLTGGTAVSIGMLARRMRSAIPLLSERVGLTRGEFGLITRRLDSMPAEYRTRLLPLDESRIRLLPAGAALLGVIIDSINGRYLTVVNRDLRWGIVIRGG